MGRRIETTYRSALARHRHVLWSADPESDLPSLPEYRPEFLEWLPRAVFDDRLATPRLGRFYPSRVLSGRRDPPAALFRVHALEPARLRVDFNAPLAGLSPRLRSENGGAPGPCVGRARDALHWAGMEAPLAAGATDFAEPEAFARTDPTEDAIFYRVPRRVLHVDAVCAARITALYGQVLPVAGPVLDLMASWRSHLPVGLAPAVGLGMNAEEMADNPQLRQAVVHDLNLEPRLPFPDASFDAVVNTVSIEYLLEPARVLAEIRRVLVPGGRLVVSFSHRFFAPKAIALWTRLHPVERLGWVLQLLAAAGFTDLETCMERGLARATEDRYAARLPEMDPLFAVWGRRTPGAQ